LLVAEITLVCKKDPGDLYAELTGDLGDSLDCRSVAAATEEQVTALEDITARNIHEDASHASGRSRTQLLEMTIQLAESRLRP
jgi:hypothetical protein